MPKAGITQTIRPSIFLICTPRTLWTVRKGFDWTGPTLLADPRVLTNQVVFAECVSQCLEVPAPIALSVVPDSPLYCLTFPEAMRVIHPLSAMLLGLVSVRLLWKCILLSVSAFSGVPCHHNTCFSRPRTGFWAAAWSVGYISSHLVVASTTVSTCHLLWQVCGSVLSSSCHVLHISISAIVLHTKEALFACLITERFTFIE